MKTRAALVCILVCALLCSCGRERRNALMELDRTLENRTEYTRVFEARMDSVKKAFPADASDSLRWEFAYSMYEIYRYYDIDSVYRYVRWLEELSARTADADQLSLTSGANVRLLRSKDSYADAVQLFESMDTSGLKPTTVRKYYSTGVTLYMHALRYKNLGQLEGLYQERLRHLRAEYTARFYDKSVHCRYMTALAYRDYGQYDYAMGILKTMLSREDLNMHDQALISYYIASVYELLGDTRSMEDWLIRGSILELKVPVKDYNALFNLASLLFREKDYARSSTYMDVALKDALSMSMVEILKRNSSAYSLTSRAAYESEQAKNRILTLGLIVILVFVAVVFAMLLYTIIQRKKLARAYETISSMNLSLKDSNKIKDNYVARYMKLSTHYMRQVDESRRELRKIARSDGLEGVMAYLRSPLYADTEFKHFYKVFDETFLGIFPKFVEKVNELLPPENMFFLKNGELNTELRILAVIRLGITKSPEIAEVLNCSVRTVYKYRFTLRSTALCPNDEFEERISLIDIND